MTYRTLLLVVVLVLPAVLWLSTSPVVAGLPARQDEGDWEGDFESIPPELCPPGEDSAKDVPVFGEVVAREVEGFSEPVWVGSGLVANAQGEVFQINVNGQNPDAVKSFTDQVRVCLDVVLTGKPLGTSDDKGGEQGTPSDKVERSDEDLFIAFDLAAVLPEETDPALVEEVVAEGGQSEDWRAKLEEQGANGTAAWIEANGQEVVLDWVFDPFIPAGTVHNYMAQFMPKAWADWTRNSASVTIGLYRNYNWWEGNVHPLDHDGGGTWSRYDLCVSGGASGGTYAVWGRYVLGEAHWSAGWYVDKPEYQYCVVSS